MTEFKNHDRVIFASDDHAAAYDGKNVTIPKGTLGRIDDDSPGAGRRIPFVLLDDGRRIVAWRENLAHATEAKTEVLPVFASKLKAGDVVVDPIDKSSGIVKVRREVPVKPALPTENGTIIRRKKAYAMARAVRTGAGWYMLASGVMAHPDDWQDGWEIVPPESEGEHDALKAYSRGFADGVASEYTPLPTVEALALAIRGGAGNILEPRAGTGDMVKVDSGLAAARVERLLKGE